MSLDLVMILEYVGGVTTFQKTLRQLCVAAAVAA